MDLDLRHRGSHERQSRRAARPRSSSRLVLLIAAAAMLLPWAQRVSAAPSIIATVPVGASPGGVAFDAAHQRVYSANNASNNVSVIDTTTNTEILPRVAAGDGPTGIAVNDVTNRMYVGNFNDGTVMVFDTTTNPPSLLTTLPGFKVNVNDGPNDIGINRATNKVYVGRTIHFGGAINVIDGATNSVSSIGGLGSHPVSLAVNETTNRIYTANQLSNSVSVIDGVSASVITSIGGFSSPVGVAVDPSANRIYVGNNAASSVKVIDGTTNTIIATIPTSTDPFRLVADADPLVKRLYVTHRTPNLVSVIDMTTNSVLLTIPGLSAPHGITIAPALHREYVANLSGNSVAVIGEPLPVVTTLTSAADTYVRQGGPDTNEGASTFLRIQDAGNNRALVRFDQSAIQTAMGSGTLVSAKLQVTITDNGNNWGTSGRTVDAHRVTVAWVEGNGFVDGGMPPNRGNGSGATWECAIDSNITNQQADCSGATEWSMSGPSARPWVATPTATVTITNGQTGVIEFDVTTDVAAFVSGSATNAGWIIKKTNEGQPGRAHFGSRETGSPPKLVLTVQP